LVVAIGSGLWETLDMKKPELHMRKWSGNGQTPIEAVCSSCGNAIPSFVAARGGKPEDNKAELQAAFDRHFKETHLREDASPTARHGS
jgi:hypothetical protein